MTHAGPSEFRVEQRHYRGLYLNREVHESSKIYLYFTAAFIAKIFLSAMTPLSSDFLANVSFTEFSWRNVLASGFYAPWYGVMKSITSLWALLPMEHPSLNSSIGFWYVTPNVSIMTLLMMQKAPLLIFDAATALVIGRIVATHRSPHLAQQAVLLWLINPYVTLTTEMFGTWDIVSAFFLLVAVWMFAKGRFLESGVSLGLGIAAKMYPLLALPIFLMFLTREKVKSTLRFAVGTLGTYSIVGALPMILGAGHRGSVETLAELAYVGGNVWGYTLNSTAVYTVGISVLVVASILFTLGFFVLWEPRRTSILEAVLCLYLLVFAFSYWETQFLLNLLPLLTIYYFVAERRNPPFFAYVSSALAFVLLDFGYYYASWGHSFFFIPNYNQVFQHYSNLLLFIRQWPIGGGDVSTLLTSPVRSIFVAVSLYYSAWIFLRNTDKQLLRRILGGAFVN